MPGSTCSQGSLRDRPAASFRIPQAPPTPASPRPALAPAPPRPCLSFASASSRPSLAQPLLSPPRPSPSRPRPASPSPAPAPSQLRLSQVPAPSHLRRAPASSRPSLAPSPQGPRAPPRPAPPRPARDPAEPRVAGALLEDGIRRRTPPRVVPVATAEHGGPRTSCRGGSGGPRPGYSLRVPQTPASRPGFQRPESLHCLSLPRATHEQ